MAYNILKYSKKMPQRDYAFIAKAYYNAGKYKEAEKLFNKTDIKYIWPLKALNNYRNGNYSEAKQLVSEGISKYSGYVSEEDYKKAVDMYLKNESAMYSATSYLLSISNGSKKDYIWSLKCKYSPINFKDSCYGQLYANFPNSSEKEDILANLILYKVVNKDYKNAIKYSDEFIQKYPESKNMPMVMFLKAKIEQKYTHNPNFEIFYKNIVNNYPDSYYAYRSFWIVSNFKDSVINTKMEFLPVEYPYQYPPKSDILYNLILVSDYDLIENYSDDDFIKSWAQYMQGNYSKSAHTAREGMNKIKEIPPKTDVRWRLVYPLNFYKQVSNESSIYGNNKSLIMAIMREESHFNPDSQSSAGAIGLMQLMPDTAHDVGIKNGYVFNTKDLLNPELNIKIGNIYYSTLRAELDNMDVSAVASYNGGIRSVLRWKNNIQYTDTDEFIEQIPYDETRDYVKKVFKSYWNYMRIYQKN